MDLTERSALHDQIMRRIFALPVCPDGYNGVACPRCIATAWTDHAEEIIDAARLAR